MKNLNFPKIKKENLGKTFEQKTRSKKLSQLNLCLPYYL